MLMLVLPMAVSNTEDDAGADFLDDDDDGANTTEEGCVKKV